MSNPFTRSQLIKLIEDGIVPQSEWSDRDSYGAQKQLGEAYVLLKAGCQFDVLQEGMLITDKDTIWLEITSRGFNDFENGTDASEKSIFYLPTRSRLTKAAGGDWY